MTTPSIQGLLGPNYTIAQQHQKALAAVRIYPVCIFFPRLNATEQGVLRIMSVDQASLGKGKAISLRKGDITSWY